LVFEKNANFFAENCQKSQKIVIITLTPGWPGEFLKKSPKMLPSPSFQNYYKTFTVEKGSPKICATWVIFEKKPAIRKQSPNRLKFAQSGRPGSNGQTNFSPLTNVN
jgi:hypothetical protein